MAGADDPNSRSSGMKSFLITVGVIFLIIVAVVVGLAVFGSDDGMLPFDYEGF